MSYRKIDKTHNIKGIRIKTVNYVMLSLSIILFLIVLYTTVRLSRGYEANVRATEHYLNWEKSAHDMHVASDYLTEQSRLFAQTGKRVYADNFFNELLQNRTREKALEFFENEGMLPEDNNILQDSLALSNALSQEEVYAIRLVAEAQNMDLSSFPAALAEMELTPEDYAKSPAEKMAAARKILYNEEYQATKKNIITGLSDFLNKNLVLTRSSLENETKRLGTVLAEQRLVLIALCLLNILTFAMIIVLIVRPLQVYLKCIRDDKMIELIGAYEFKHLALTYNDIFAIKEHHDKMLKYRAEHDPLTGLLNRSAFDSLHNILSGEREPIGLLLVDVDKFKSINDNYGHAVGDAALCRVATLLQHNFRSDDFCIRIGGDEFAVILPKVSSDVVKIVKEKIAAINHTLKNPSDNLPPLSLSVGGAISHEGFTRTLYTNADSALYSVKEAGRCGCAFFEDTEKALDAMPKKGAR